jgi:fructosamine-3-kinase
MTESELIQLATLALPTQKLIVVRLLKRRYAGAVLDVTTSTGRRLVLKTGATTYNPKLEAAMLEALRAGGLPVPVVRDIRSGTLVLEHCSGRTLTVSGDWLAAARALRDLHAATRSSCYGFQRDTVFGVLPLANRWSNDWPRFFCNQRLRPLLKLGRSSGRLPEPEAARLEAICEAIPARMPPPTAAALIHGDVWSKNVLMTAAGPIFLDPACFYTDRHYEIAFAQTYAPRRTAIAALWQSLETRRHRDETRLRTGYYRLSFHLAHLVLFGQPCYLRAVGNWLTALETPRSRLRGRRPAASFIRPCMSRRTAPQSLDHARTVS